MLDLLWIFLLCCCWACVLRFWKAATGVLLGSSSESSLTWGFKILAFESTLLLNFARWLLFPTNERFLLCDLSSSIALTHLCAIDCCYICKHASSCFSTNGSSSFVLNDCEELLLLHVFEYSSSSPPKSHSMVDTGKKFLSSSTERPSTVDPIE